MSATLKNIAEMTGLSVPTVAHVLSGSRAHLFRPETREKVLAAAKKLNYRPMSAPKAMRSRRTMQIGVLVKNGEDYPLHYLPAYEMILGINLYAEAAGYVVTLLRVGDVAGNIEDESRLFREHLIDGLIVISEIPAKAEAAVQKLGLPVVWLDSSHWGDKCCVRRNEYEAGRMAAQQTLDRGYRKVIWYGLNMSNGHSQLRRQGALDCLREAGIEPLIAEIPDVVPSGLPWERHFNPDTAVIVYDSSLARRIGFIAVQLGRRPGLDFSLCSCDSTHDVELQWPGLSRVDHDRYNLGRHAVDMLLASLGPKGILQPSVDYVGKWIEGSTMSVVHC